MATLADPITVPLLIDGAAVDGAAGTYEVTNPARPSEVVLHAPAATSAQLDDAAGAARRAQAAWAALDMDARAALVIDAARAAVQAVEERDLARLLTCEHGKVYWEAVFDASTMGAMAEGFAPMATAALAPRRHGHGASLVEWAPHGVVGAILPFNWPVSVLANKVLP